MHCGGSDQQDFEAKSHLVLRAVRHVDHRAAFQEYVNCLPIDPRSLILVGEAGIGKTTLWNHAVVTCRAAGGQVLVTRVAELGPPTLQLAQLLAVAGPSPLRVLE